MVVVGGCAARETRNRRALQYGGASGELAFSRCSATLLLPACSRLLLLRLMGLLTNKLFLLVVFVGGLAFFFGLGHEVRSCVAVRRCGGVAVPQRVRLGD